MDCSRAGQVLLLLGDWRALGCLWRIPARDEIAFPTMRGLWGLCAGQQLQCDPGPGLIDQSLFLAVELLGNSLEQRKYRDTNNANGLPCLSGFHFLSSKRPLS